MGFSLSKTVKGAANAVTLGASSGNFGDIESIGRGFGDFTTGGAGNFMEERAKRGLPPLSQEQITTANVFSKLTPEQQKDLLINNPNIQTSQGSQFYDPSTNTIRLEESEFQTGQRGRQEQLAQELSGQLTGQTLPGTDPAARYEEARKLLEPQFQQDRDRVEQMLADSGLPIGSEAYNEEKNRLEQSQGLQLQSAARESVATSEAQRAARFNEISSLLGQQQVGGTSFGDFNANKSGLDLFGAEQSSLNRTFQAAEAAKDRSAAKRAALIGAVGTSGGAAVGAPKGTFTNPFSASDRTLKENIKEVGKSENGLTIYHFDYINKEHGEGRFEGVMAQDLLESNPQAIIQVGDKLAVNYDLIDVDFRRIN